MKALVAVALICLAVVPLACGGSEPAASAGGADTTQGATTPQGQPPESTTAVKAKLPHIGSYPQDGPFAAISGGEGNEIPHIDPANRPPPKNPLVRDLEKGSGPAAEVGDELTAYYAGAVYKTGKVKYYGWPPATPMSLELGSGIFPKLWELGFKGLRPGGVREVVAPSRFFAGTGAIDYVMVLLSVNGSSDQGAKAQSEPASQRSEPENLVIKDLKIGSGAAAEAGDRVSVLYIAHDYDTGEEWFHRWGADVPLSIRLGWAGYSLGLEEGIEGMRVGGRRRLTIPARLTNNEGPLVYLVELVRLKPEAGS
jgi:FKBP-type peptidyl-prolyl cis-trans isomerase